MVARPEARALLALLLIAAPATAEPARLTAGDGVAVRVGKLFTMDAEDRVFAPGMLLVEDGRIAYVGEPVEVPEGYRTVEEPALWAWPGMVDLHTHIHATGWHDLNDMVGQLNPGLRARPAYEPDEPRLAHARAAGVTTMFGIPGSGTSISGFGILYKPKKEGRYAGSVLRDPGGMKSAFNYNPQRSVGLARTWAGLNHSVTRLNDAVARRAADPEGEAHPDDWQLEDLESVHRGELPVLVHCASSEGVAGVVRTWKRRYGTECVVSHGSWDGHRSARFAAENGVPVNHGPRTMNFTSAYPEDRVQGGAAAFQDAGVPLFSLNTDSPIVPEEEFFLQGSMSARLGADPYQMVRALTTHPAESILVGDRVGSLEVGKDADVVLTTGDLLDPRSRIELVIVDGEVQHSIREDGQLF